ncbi:MAG: hypothetical protein KGR48_05100 [Alphaproteobacteria bacterium]|nr:hypothetical protein [Alphaproteobacteria bacterium]MDE2072340.1 hypothetical protein [Alphaproteobacteria bacterium]MDE2351578.1 hypothetical protein [Alphaproteobacteria bacterium]
MLRLRYLVLMLALIAAAPRAPAAEGGCGAIVEYPAMKSPFMAPVDVTVWLPLGYAASKARYAVVYLQDGQNLFDTSPKPSGSPDGAKWGADTVAAGLMAKGEIRPAILVGVANLGIDRSRQYVPEAVYARLPAAVRKALHRQFGGAPFSDAYLRFLVETLKPFIDAHYRTDPGRASTFVMGSSMGGLIALYALGQYPEVFGGAACLSTHWPVVLPGPGGTSYAGADPPFAPAVTRAFVAYLRAKLGAPRGRRLWFDHGTRSLDAYYGPYQQRIDRAVAGLGWRRGVDFESRVYPGATHNEHAWRARLAEPLEFLLKVYEAPSH